jgi:acid phosphatase type 7
VPILPSWALALTCGVATIAFSQIARATDDLGAQVGTVFAVGDIAECVDAKFASLPANLKAAEIKSGKAVAELIRKHSGELATKGVIVRVLALGDLAYDNGTVQSMKCFEQAWGDLRDITLPVPGNHEYDEKTKDGLKYDKKQKRHAGPYLQSIQGYKLLQDQTSNGAALQHLADGYYAIDFPSAAPSIVNWRILAVNSNIAVSESSDQLRFFKNDLTTQKNTRCILAISHAFRHSSGRHGHGQNSKIALGAILKPERTMSPLWSVLLNSGASLHLAGHDHDFEQIGPSDVEGKSKIDGIRSFVVGTGGTELHRNNYSFKLNTKEHIELDEYGVLQVDLFERGYEWRFLPSEGAPIVPNPNSATCNLRK